MKKYVLRRENRILKIALIAKNLQKSARVIAMGDKKMNDNLENGWIDTEDKEVVQQQKYVCYWCGEDILEGDYYYKIGEEKICCDCISDCKRIA